VLLVKLSLITGFPIKNMMLSKRKELGKAFAIIVLFAKNAEKSIGEIKGR